MYFCRTQYCHVIKWLCLLWIGGHMVLSCGRYSHLVSHDCLCFSVTVGSQYWRKALHCITAPIYEHAMPDAMQYKNRLKFYPCIASNRSDSRNKHVTMYRMERAGVGGVRFVQVEGHSTLLMLYCEQHYTQCLYAMQQWTALHLWCIVNWALVFCWCKICHCWYIENEINEIWTGCGDGHSSLLSLQVILHTVTSKPVQFGMFWSPN